jgi:hypothetical protein
MYIGSMAVLAGRGSGVVQQLFMFLIVGLCVAAIWWVGRYIAIKMKLPQGVLDGWNIIFILVGLVVLINFLLGLGGHQFIPW